MVVPTELSGSPRSRRKHLEKEYEERAVLVMADGADSATSDSAERNDLVRRAPRRAANTSGRPSPRAATKNLIDDIELREPQAAMAEEVQPHADAE